MAPFTPPLPIEIHVGLETWEKNHLSTQGVDVQSFRWLLVLKTRAFDPNESMFVLGGQESDVAPKSDDVLAKEIAARLGAYRWYDKITFRGQVVSLVVITENPPPR